MHVTLYCDGSASNNHFGREHPKNAGWSVIVSSLNGATVEARCGPVVIDKDHPRFIGAEQKANNTAELSALIEACIWLCGPKGTDVEKATIYGDSDYAFKQITGQHQTHENIQLVENAKDWYFCAQTQSQLTIELVHRDLNKSADILAKRAMQMQYHIVDNWRDLASLENTKLNTQLQQQEREKPQVLQESGDRRESSQIEKLPNEAKNNSSGEKKVLQLAEAEALAKNEKIERQDELFQQLGVLPLTAPQKDILRTKGCTLLIGSLGHINSIFRFKYSVYTSGIDGKKQFVKDSEIFPVSTQLNDPNYVGAATQTIETADVCAFIYACTWLLNFLSEHEIKAGPVLIECKNRTMVDIINNITQPICLFVVSNQTLVLRAQSLLLQLNKSAARKVIFKPQDQALEIPFFL
jgi:ribonuclease HI